MVYITTPVIPSWLFLTIPIPCLKILFFYHSNTYLKYILYLSTFHNRDVDVIYMDVHNV